MGKTLDSISIIDSGAIQATAAEIRASAPARRRATRTRSTKAGDTGPTDTPEHVEEFVVEEAISAAREARLNAMKDVLSGVNPEESSVLLKTLLRQQ